MPSPTILVINTGSSSLKFGLYQQIGSGGPVQETMQIDGEADGIGRDNGKLTVTDASGTVLHEEDLHAATQAEALDHAVRWLHSSGQPIPSAIGHRVVHGGPHLVTHQRITPDLLQQLRDSVHFAPLHIPSAINLIESAGRLFPSIPQFACFDTAFHRTLPETASRFALPRDLFDAGIRRYGFHGLSYESVVFTLGRDLPGRTVIAHLGSGASLAAVADGKSVDTSMGLTPAGGIPMASRTGDLDPGVLLYLERTGGKDVDSLEQLVNHGSGLAAISGSSGDMRDLEVGAKAGDAEAELAIAIFCTAIRKTVAAYAAVLGGLDLLVFAGGIGEHSVRVRAEVCRGLRFLGIDLNEEQNEGHAGLISAAGSPIAVRIVPSEEDLQIARHCRELMASATA